MEPRDAIELIGSAERLRRRTRAIDRTVWFPLFVLGALTLGSAPICRTDGFFYPFEPWNLYWLVAGPAAYAAIAGYYLFRDRSTGVGGEWGRVRPYVVAGLLMVAVANWYWIELPVFNASNTALGSAVALSVAFLIAALAAWAILRRSLGALLVGAAVVLVLVPNVHFPAVSSDAFQLAAMWAKRVALVAVALVLCRMPRPRDPALLAVTLILGVGVLGGYLIDQGPNAEPVIGVALSLLVLAWIQRSRLLALVAAAVGLSAYALSFNVVNDLMFGAHPHATMTPRCGVDLALIAALLLGSAGVAFVTDRWAMR
jgi:hypothetical protein